jgi:hypothetical protein
VDVVVSVSDASGQEVFHTFKVAVKGGPGEPAPPPEREPDPPRAAESRPPAPIKEAPLKRPIETRRLPASADALVVGGGGRFLVLRLPSLRKLAVFDANEARVVKYLPLDEPDAHFAAGLDSLFVALPKAGRIVRYSLATFGRDGSFPLPAEGAVQHLLMGSGSRGPLLLATAVDRGPGVLLLDPRTLTPLDVDTKTFGGPRSDQFLRVSADGRVFTSYNPGLSPQGHLIRVLEGKTIKQHGLDAGMLIYGHATPGPDGRHVYTTYGPFTTEGKPVGKLPARDTAYSLPAAEGGAFALNIDLSRGPRRTLTVHLAGDPRPLEELFAVDLPRDINTWDRERLGNDQRITFIPSAKLLVVLPESNDRLRLYRADPDAMLAGSKIDYLVVTSRPPAEAARGAELRYDVAVKSKKGGVKVKLESGPVGMKVTPEGRLTWPVPKDFAGTEAEVLLSVSDASGKETFHSFKLSVRR